MQVVRCVKEFFEKKFRGRPSHVSHDAAAHGYPCLNAWNGRRVVNTVILVATNANTWRGALPPQGTVTGLVPSGEPLSDGTSRRLYRRLISS